MKISDLKINIRVDASKALASLSAVQRRIASRRRPLHETLAFAVEVMSAIMIMFAGTCFTFGIGSTMVEARCAVGALVGTVGAELLMSRNERDASVTHE